MKNLGELELMQLERMQSYLEHESIRSPKKVKGETYWMGYHPVEGTVVIPSRAYRPPYPG